MEGHELGPAKRACEAQQQRTVTEPLQALGAERAMAGLQLTYRSYAVLFF